jgi:hypothetical protein
VGEFDIEVLMQVIRKIMDNREVLTEPLLLSKVNFTNWTLDAVK